MSAGARTRRPGREARLLRVFLGEDDRVHGRPASEAVVEAARRAGLAGATVFRGSLGYGADSTVHRAEPFRLSSDLPLVVEIVDDADRIDAFLPALEGLLLGGGLITLEAVRVLGGAAPEGSAGAA